MSKNHLPSRKESHKYKNILFLTVRKVCCRHVELCQDSPLSQSFELKTRTEKTYRTGDRSSERSGERRNK